MIRRDFLKRVGLVATGVALSDPITKAETAINLSGSAAAAPQQPKSDIHVKIRSPKPQTDKPITVVIIGAGNRGDLFLSPIYSTPVL